MRSDCIQNFDHTYPATKSERKQAKMRSGMAGAAICSLALAFGASAEASTIQTITYSDSGTYTFKSEISDSSPGVTTQTASAAAGRVNLNQTDLALRRFDPRLGTILNVTLKFVESANSTVSETLSCKDTAFGIGTTDACNSATSSSSIVTGVDADIPFDTTDFTEIDGTKVINVNGGLFGAFIGTRSIVLPWRVDWNHFASGRCVPDFPSQIEVCNLASTADVSIGFDVSVTYTYRTPPPPPPPPNPVPLPAGMPLLLAALGGLAFLRRRR